MVPKSFVPFSSTLVSLVSVCCWVRTLLECLMRPLAARQRQIVSNPVRIALDFRRSKTMQNAGRITNLSEEYRNSLDGEPVRAASRLEQHTIYRAALISSTMACLSAIQKRSNDSMPMRNPRALWHSQKEYHNYTLPSVVIAPASSVWRCPQQTLDPMDPLTLRLATVEAMLLQILNLQSSKRLQRTRTKANTFLGPP
jgi:hypothetical protein